MGAEIGGGGFLGSGPAGVRLNAGESLLERILGRDVLAVVAITKWLLLVCTGSQRLGPLLRQVLLVGDAVADPQVVATVSRPLFRLRDKRRCEGSWVVFPNQLDRP